MIIIVSLMLLNEGMLQETKIITLPIIATTQNSESIIYISGPPSEEKNPPPSSGSAYGLADYGPDWVSRLTSSQTEYWR